VSQLKLRGKSTEPAQNPLIQIIIDVCNRAKGGSLFQSGCQGIQVQGTHKHATMLPSRQHLKKKSIKPLNSVYYACIGGMLGS
jgi:hypothetical protein